MKPEQKDIYYLISPTRDAALNSPYLETFEKAGVQVLFGFSAIDDFVMGNLKEYEGRPLVSIERGDIDLKDLVPPADSKGQDDDIYKADRELTTKEKVELCTWFKKEFEEELASCTVTTRLSSSPAIVTDHESGALRRMMKMVDTTEAGRDQFKLPKQHMEINPNHKIILGINELKTTQPSLAKVLAAQVFDNCLVAAGLLDDSRSMLPRLNDLLICVVNGAKENPNATVASEGSECQTDDGDAKTSETSDETKEDTESASTSK
mmetsp:Transcript_28295/g.66182  ORF Transcript_28295/g.66182 Transcript_28295/m.66182 type:complete len:264 (+) Transcript_28295:3-794(+)